MEAAMLISLIVSFYSNVCPFRLIDNRDLFEVFFVMTTTCCHHEGCQKCVLLGVCLTAQLVFGCQISTCAVFSPQGLQSSQNNPANSPSGTVV